MYKKLSQLSRTVDRGARHFLMTLNFCLFECSAKPHPLFVTPVGFRRVKRRTKLVILCFRATGSNNLSSASHIRQSQVSWWAPERRWRTRRRREKVNKKQENKVGFLRLSLPSAHWFLCAQSRNKPHQSVHLFLRYLNKQITKINQCETSKPDQSVFRSPSPLTASGRPPISPGQYLRS